jgi:hypothetical protein
MPWQSLSTPDAGITYLSITPPLALDERYKNLDGKSFQSEADNFSSRSKDTRKLTEIELRSPDIARSSDTGPIVSGG